MEMVQLITMHSSKGLEFDTVFIPGLADGIVPYSMGGKSSDVHEEERLLYVAMTRAKNNLFLSHAQQAMVFGKSLSMQASPFLKRIDDKLKEMEKTERKQKKKEDKDDGQLGLF